MARHTPPSMLGRLIYATSLGAWQRPWLVLVVAALLTATAWQGVKQIRIDTNLQALLPNDHQTVRRLEEVRDRVGAQSDLLIEIHSPSREANLRFGAALAAKMRAMPDLRYVIYRRDMASLKRNALLFLPLKDLLDLHQHIVGRIRKEVGKRVAVQLDDEELPSKKTVKKSKWDQDPESLLKASLGGAIMPTTYLEADEGRLVVIKARPKQATTNVQFCIRLVKNVREVIASLKPQSFHPQLRAEPHGDYVSRAGETQSIRDSVTTTIGFALGLLVLVIFLFFRSIVALPLVLLPVVFSSLLTVGIAGALVDKFNLVTTFIFAVLLGLGIDFPIHYLARYTQQRRRGDAWQQALEGASARTGIALLAGAVTTALAFFSLLLAEFRGFSQFGAVAGLGVLLALLTTYTLVPALLRLAERVSPRSFAARTKAPDSSTEGSPSGSPSGSQDISRSLRYRLVAMAILSVSLATAGFALAKYQQIPFEYDFGKLGKKKPAKVARQGAKKQVGYRDATGGKTAFGPAVALCDDVSTCEEVIRLMQALTWATKQDLAAIFGAHAVGVPQPASLPVATSTKADDDDDDLDDDDDDDGLDDDGLGDAPKQDPYAELRRSFGAGRLLPQERERLRALGYLRVKEMRHFQRAFIGIHSLIPAHQETKLKIIADIKQRIDRRRSRFSPELKKKVKTWDEYLQVKEPLTVSGLPKWFTDQLSEKDGTSGRFVVIWNAGRKANYIFSKRLHQAFFDLPTPRAKVAVAANYFVLVEVIDTLRKEGPRVLGTVVGLVFICLLLTFRSLKASILVLLPLFVSLGWLCATFLLLGWKVNMFSIVAFPLLLGMGIDNGIHVFHRWRETANVRVIVRDVGGPITLTTLTTFIGFAGLLLANHVGIQTLGLTAGVGMWFTHLGATMALPALLYLVDNKAREDSVA
ncbi:MAG: MMPL family transporter [Deltaproteobacteria bacterium]|nr:MMPL family transporter [Deltaproteobacteria bacterium]